MADSATSTVTYLTDTGPQPAVMAIPVGREPSAGLLFVHENKGLTTYMLGVVEDLAALGWLVLAPDLLARLTADAEEVNTRQVPMERHVSDIRNALDELEARVSPLPVGMVGFCFGGEVALEAARGRTEVRALAAWYGVPPPVASDLPEPILLVLASDDDRVNQHTDGFMERLGRANKDYVVQTYTATRHAFHDWSRPDRHSPRAAGAAWEECCGFLRRHLG